jgi:hypothetical protein
MNTVLLAAPLIVFALVLLLGFAGCWLDKEGKGRPSDGTDGTDGTGGPDTGYAGKVKDFGPIAWWRLLEPKPVPGADLSMIIAADHVGPPPWGDHPGKYHNVATGQGPAAEFDGALYVEVDPDPVFAMEQFTITALVHPDSVGPGSVIVSSMSSSGGWALSIFPPSTEPAIDGYFAALVSDGSASGGPSVGFDLATPGSGHVAMTYDGANVTLYVDGSASPPLSQLYVANTQAPLQIGVGFQGTIRDVAVFNQLLGADKISELAIAAGPEQPGP